MERHILFFDIDGTLLDEEKDIIPESAVWALRQAKENGHLLFVCSGRCLAIIPDEVKALGFDGMIGGCGTYIEIGGRQIYHQVIPELLQKELIMDLLRYHIDGVLEGRDCSSFRHDYWMPVVKSIFAENGKFSRKESFTARTQCYWDEDFSFDKMALWFDESSDMDSFRHKYEDRFEFIRRDPTFFEVVPKGISKATGIRRVCDEMGIDIQKSIAFGDSSNDLPMLQCVGISVAMGSGNPVLFDQVDYVTDPVMEDGIANALRHLHMI